MDEKLIGLLPGEDIERSPALFDLLLITRAYNQKEISLDDWLRQSREWAQAVIRQSQLPLQLDP